jgi:hypothetical protein
VYNELVRRGKSFAGGAGVKLRNELIKYGGMPFHVDRKQLTYAGKHGMCTRTYAQSIVDAYRLRLMDSTVIKNWVAIVDNPMLRWDPITSIDAAERPLVTYDFSVDGKDAFAIDGNFLTHNTANFHVPVSDKAVEQAKRKMLPSDNLFSLTDLQSVRHAPSMEMTFGLYQLTRGASKKPVRKFLSVNEAQDAYKAGEIAANDPIEIVSMRG